MSRGDEDEIVKDAVGATPPLGARASTAMRDVNGDGCAVDRALASARVRIAACERAQRAMATACGDAVRAVLEDGWGGDGNVAREGVETARARAEGIVNERGVALMRLADERVRLAQCAYDLVDEHITRLDKDLATFEKDAATPVGRGRNDYFTNGDGSGAMRHDGFGDGFANGSYEDSPSVANPNEPKYCVCRQVSYGEMIGCDRDDCPIEWYHVGCVGLTTIPKGKWVCALCKRRGATNE